MSALGKLMKIAKFGKTLNRVILVLSIVASIAVLAVFMFFLVETESSSMETVKLTGKSDREFIVQANDIILYFLALILYLVKSVYSSSVCFSYFSLVVKEKTPFRADAAIALNKLGIVAVVFPVINDIITRVFRHFMTSEIFSSSLVINYNPLPSFALGAMFFVCSAISRYGAEVRGRKKVSE